MEKWSTKISLKENALKRFPNIFFIHFVIYRLHNYIMSRDKYIRTIDK